MICWETYASDIIFVFVAECVSAAMVYLDDADPGVGVMAVLRVV